MHRRNRLIAVLVGATVCALSGCGEFPETQSSSPGRPADMSQVPDAVPQNEPRSRYGNPSSYMVYGKTYTVLPACQGYHERGIASWYGPQFHGGRTSSGETYDMYAMTAANKVLPLPCYVRVTNLSNGRSVVVKVNDRGPFVDNRLIDLSYAAASKLDMIGTGTALVDVQAVGPGETAVPAPIPQAPAAGTVAAAPAVTSAPATLATAGAGRPELYLQVGAFADRDNAESLKTKLGTAGIEPVFVLTVNDGSRTLYKVRIGPLPDVDSVDTLTGRLGGLGYTDVQVVIP